MTTNLKLVCDEIDREHELRNALHVASEESTAALKLRDKASAAVEAASAKLAEVEEEQRQFDTLDADIAESRALQIAESLESGGGFPELVTPPALGELALKRIDAENRLVAIGEATKRLRVNLDEAERTLATARANAAMAAKAVAGFFADGMATTLANMEHEAAHLRSRLYGATALRPGGALPLNSDTFALLRDDPANQIISRSGMGASVYWDQLIAKLLRDSEATLE